MFLFQLYHQISKQKSKGSVTNKPVDQWPDQWKTTYCKVYERFPLVVLPKPKNLEEKSFSEVVALRRTHRFFKETVTLFELSTLFYYSVAETDSKYDNGSGRRMYPSGGARYPLEFYLLVLRPTEGLLEGVYHYSVTEHGLRCIRKKGITGKDLAYACGYAFVEDAKCAIIFTASFSRVKEKYEEIAYRFILLEAGGVMQNFSLTAEALGIHSASLGGLAEDVIEPLLGIDGTEESVVHMMVFG